MAHRYSDRLRKADHEVRTVRMRTARELVSAHHYARGGSNTATFRHGLFRKESEQCLGVAWWIPPTRPAAVATWSGPPDEVLALSRMVLVPEAPKNAATFLLARSVQLIRADGRYRCLVTYADTWQGHTGALYRLAGWEPLGLTEAKPIWVSPSGVLVSPKCGRRTRTRADLEAMGCVCEGRFRKHKFRLVLPTRRRSAPRPGVESRRGVSKAIPGPRPVRSKNHQDVIDCVGERVGEPVLG